MVLHRRSSHASNTGESSDRLNSNVGNVSDEPPARNFESFSRKVDDEELSPRQIILSLDRSRIIS